MNAQFSARSWVRILDAIWWLSLGLAGSIWLLVPFGGGDEIVGNSAFAFLVSAVFINVAIVASYALPSGRRFVVRGAWIALAVGSLAFALAVAMRGSPAALKDSNTFVAIAVYALSFPLGLLGAFVISALPDWITRPSMASLVVTWTAFVIFGYVQWFRLFPWIICHMQEWRSRA